MTEEQTKPRVDIYARVTDEIVKAIEAGVGKFVMPWHGLSYRWPRNAVTTKAYAGINTLMLWASARNKKHASSYWATYRQWESVSARVRKGERGTMIILYKEVPVEAEDARTGERVVDYRLIARPYYVFNSAQVDGWTEPPLTFGGAVTTIQEIDNAIEATGADIRRGEKPMYVVACDYVSMPPKESFGGSPTSEPTEAYYSTLFHELIHWTGHWSRLGRNLSGRFGTHDYAMEELVAELGAAYLCAEFLVLHLPREDHAAYINEWLGVLKADKRAIFAASAHAMEAVEFLLTA
jgi:antirestriction protein ArdC